MDKKLKNEIAKKVNKMEQNLQDENKVRARWLFIDKFVCCEVACKMVMNAYHKDEGKEIALKDETLNMTTILAAMKWAELIFDKEDLNALFSSGGDYKKRGKKSAKLLRHGSMHEHNENDIQEIVDRFEELNGMMDDFLSRLRKAEVKEKKKEAVPA